MEAVVRRYYAVVADLASTEQDLLEVLAPDVRIVEHPNSLTPQGTVRNLEETLAGFRAGKSLLGRQAFDVHEVIADGDRAALRVTFSATVGVDRGPFTAGTRLTAHTAAFATVREGRIIAHETFDCYPPWS